MSKTGINIYKRKDGRWEGRYIKGYTENGKIAYCYVYAKTFTEVKNKLKIKPVAVPIIPTYNHSYTFADISRLWISNVELKVKQSTLSRYYAMLENHILPNIGSYKMDSLTAPIIDQFAKNMIQSGRKDGKGGLSSKTVCDILTLIKSILDYSRVENIVNTNLTITYPKYEQQPTRVLSRQEQAALEQVLKNDTDIFKAGILLCLYTGLRIGEVCTLHWGDISLDEGIVSVKQTIQRVKNINPDAAEKTRILIDTPKSRYSVRDIPLSNFIISFLSNFYSDKEDFFLSDERIVCTEPRTLQNHFKKCIKLSGIAPANYHSTRHTFATRCIEAGVDIKSLSEILGHSNINITLNRYVHSSFEQKRESINKLEAFK